MGLSEKKRRQEIGRQGRGRRQGPDAKLAWAGGRPPLRGAMGEGLAMWEGQGQSHGKEGEMATKLGEEGGHHEMEGGLGDQGEEQVRAHERWEGRGRCHELLEAEAGCHHCHRQAA